ncbi:uncharacterized protein LOC134268407 [Saccostrea cucullata]|uniref:uncharacterized protein LOC134268407 n=1 Tax=Saccostrea cuccullata TaxID=36930 RepID=UPI002ED196A3
MEEERKDTNVNQDIDEMLKIVSKICKDHGESIPELKESMKILKSIKEKVKNLHTLSEVHLTDLEIPWIKVGAGNFGRVYKSTWKKSSQVAIKVLKKQAENEVYEYKLLRYLSHENIIAYRGMGYIHSKEELEKCLMEESEEDDLRDLFKEPNRKCMFFVMEFIPTNLFRYIMQRESHETQGLSLKKAWDIGKQIASAVCYLHSEGIAHRNMIPHNILIQGYVNNFIIKITGFNLALQDNRFDNHHKKCESMMTDSDANSTEVFFDIRWGPPEFRPSLENDEIYYDLIAFKKGDIYSFGLIMYFIISGVQPFAEFETEELLDQVLPHTSHIQEIYITDQKDVIGKFIKECTNERPEGRPNAVDVTNRFYREKNPYYLEEYESELFSCGFLDKTDIFVADSCTDEDSSQMGYFESKERPNGYKHHDLICPIRIGERPNRDIFIDWDKEEKYIENYRKLRRQANKKIIDNNPTVALKSLTFSRPDEEGKRQRVKMIFKQSEYIHHRAMRDIWMSMSDEEKREFIPNKSEVNPYFSNTFGLHVAILTNEGAGNPQYFVFPQRAKGAGMPAPGAFTCGAVKSVSTLDIQEINEENKTEEKEDENGGDKENEDIEDNDEGELKRVNLVNTAIRGLREELGLELSDSEAEAVCLTTIYLKTDTHEWGLCGFVDLTDTRIKPEHRISADNLKDRFSSGPKDKFKYRALRFVKFTLEDMVDFIFENHENFASSTKLVAVKVLQAYFGWSKVKREFESRCLTSLT